MAYIRFFSSLSEILTSIAVGGGYASLFLMTALEGVPFLGMLVPGHVAVVAGGFLSSVGVLNPFLVLTVTLAGAIAGDYASFFLGRHFGWPLIDRMRRLFFIKDSHLDKAKRLLSTNAGKALIIGRFNPVTRGVMPFLVGANGIRVRSFWLWNSLGAFAWVATSVALGYLLGLGYHAAAGWLGRAVVAAIIAAVLIIWGYRFINARFHIFRRYELFALGLNLLSLYVLARMMQDAFAAQSFMAGFDVRVNSIMAQLTLSQAGMAVTWVAGWLSAAVGTTAVTIYSLGIGMILAFRKRWRSATLMLMSMAVAAVTVGWLKELVGRIRPVDLVLLAHPAWLNAFFDGQGIVMDPSFPSGHAAFAAAFFVAAAYLIAPAIRSWVRRELLIAACILLPVAVGLSRLVLNVHWASDVIAGWAIGVFSATASILLVRYLGALVADRAAEAVSPSPLTKDP